MSLPKSVEKLIGELARFPGVGRRSAERMAFDLIAEREERVPRLVEALEMLRGEIGLCQRCGYFTEGGQCLVCDTPRDRASLLVVERPMDVIAFEKAGGYRGLYHVLGGQLSPLKGIGPDDLRMDSLFKRLTNPDVSELILATSPNVEGDATALYISRHIERDDLRMTRLGRGVPMGGSLDLSDAGTLRLALESRQAVSG